MLQSSGIAAELALAHGATACTDITGFGLLGHLLEMLGGTLGARLELAQLPMLPGAVEQIEAGIMSTMHAANVRSARLKALAPDAGGLRLHDTLDADARWIADLLLRCWGSDRAP